MPPILFALIQLLPALIKMAEVIHPLPNSGQEKLNFVVTTAQTLLNAVPGMQGQVGAVISQLKPAIDGMVGVMNAAKTPPPTTPGFMGKF